MKNFKYLKTKTLALLAVMALGGDLFAAACTLVDETDTTVAAAMAQKTQTYYYRTKQTTDVSVVTATNSNTLTTSPNQKVYFCANTPVTTATLSGAMTLSKGSQVHFIKTQSTVTTGLGWVVSGTVTGPTTGYAEFWIDSGLAKLPNSLTSSAVHVVSNHDSAILESTSSAEFYLDLRQSLTLLTMTGLSGTITGSGRLVVPTSVTSISSTFSNFTGELYMAAAAAASLTYPPGEKATLALVNAYTYTITNKGSIGTVYPVVTGATLAITDSLTIGTLDLTRLTVAEKIILDVPAGKTLTITKIFSGSKGVIQCSGSGNITVKAGTTDGGYDIATSSYTGTLTNPAE